MSKRSASIDRRVVKTKLALRDALLALMSTRSWDDISIREICDRANVGRSTFYLRYQSKEDMLADSLETLRNFLLSTAAESGRKEFPFLRGLLEHIAEQRAVFKTIIGRRGGHRVAIKFKEMVRQLIEAELKQYGHPVAKSHWLSSYLTGGFFEVMSWWVDSSKAPPIAEMERRFDVLMSQILQAELSLRRA
ncbi:MAG TPA: TetR/AcrR family transcriptional regulator [Steroidobacteraceae bacterium]|nr:TetR/AcrR family transcriptional regulator [Steroidobacteraceae bacterium]